MARPAYSTRFGTFLLSTGTTHTVYTVPTGKRAVLRDIDVFCISGTNPELDVLVPGASFGFIVFSGAAAPFGAQWSGRQIWEDGETIDVFRVAGTWSGVLSGYVLDA